VTHGRTLFVASCISLTACSKPPFVAQAQKVIDGLSADSGWTQRPVLIGQDKEVLSDNGTRSFLFRSAECEIHVNVSAEGNADVAGLRGACK
jgi:hypothetical protein